MADLVDYRNADGNQHIHFEAFGPDTITRKTGVSNGWDIHYQLGAGTYQMHPSPTVAELGTNTGLYRLQLDPADTDDQVLINLAGTDQLELMLHIRNSSSSITPIFQTHMVFERGFMDTYRAAEYGRASASAVYDDTHYTGVKIKANQDIKVTHIGGTPLSHTDELWGPPVYFGQVAAQYLPGINSGSITVGLWITKNGILLEDSSDIEIQSAKIIKLEDGTEAASWTDLTAVAADARGVFKFSKAAVTLDRRISYYISIEIAVINYDIINNVGSSTSASLSTFNVIGAITRL